MKQSVIAFLKANRFKETRKNVWSNDKCDVVHTGGGYTVADKTGGIISPDENIYWLIGVLTYYGYMDKNYKQLN